MKKIIALLVAVLALGAAVPAQAGLKFGPRIGMNVNKLHFNKDELFDGANRAGFTGGVELEYISPFNVGFDVSLMYSYMNSKVEVEKTGTDTKTNIGHNFIEIPLNLKYKFGIAGISKLFAPYIFTGPSVAFKLDKGDSYFETKTTQWTWNFGLGLEFIQHLQIQASYGLGMNKVVDGVKDKYVAGATITTGDLKARNNYWTVTVGWLF